MIFVLGMFSVLKLGDFGRKPLNIYCIGKASRKLINEGVTQISHLYLAIQKLVGSHRDWKEWS